MNLTKQEIAEKLGLSVHGVRSLVFRTKTPYVKLDGKTLYDFDWLVKHIQMFGKDLTQGGL